MADKYNEIQKIADEWQKIKEKADELMEKVDSIKNLTSKSILDFEEKEVFKILIQLKKDDETPLSKYIICPQVAFSAFLKNDSVFDWYVYNLFYADFLLVDDNKEPFCVIEYQGKGGGHEKVALPRDAVKQAVCKKANIGFIELKAKQDVKNEPFETYVRRTIIEEIKSIEAEKKAKS